MIIITDLLIIDHLISVSVTLPFLPLVFRHLNSLPYFIRNFNKYNLLPKLCLKVAEWVANSVDPDEMPHFAASHLGLHCLLRPLAKYVQKKYIIW